MSTEWIVLQVDNLRSVASAADYDTMRQKAVQVGQGNPIADALSGAINTVRGSIAAGGYRRSQTPASVPPSLETDTLWIAFEQAWMRLGLRALNKDQVTRIAEARATLARIAAGKHGVETPPDPEGAPAAQKPLTGVRIVRPGKKSISAKDLHGLI